MRLFSFDSQAKNYASFCEAQKFFAQKLSEKIAQTLGLSHSSILDLGCGSGELLQALCTQNIAFDSYVGCDTSQAMLKNFKPLNAGNITLLNQDFNTCLAQHPNSTLICSSSALQWSKDIFQTLTLMAQSSANIAIAFMTSNTFSSFHRFLDSKSPLPDCENMQKLLLEFFEGKIEIIQKDLYFENNQFLIAHLRHTGVMGGGILGYKKAKKILDYHGVLEYQSLMFIGKSKKYKGAL